MRGALTAAHQLFFALGVLIAALLSMNVVLGSEARWPLLLGVSASLATAHFFLFLFCPESPRYTFYVYTATMLVAMARLSFVFRWMHIARLTASSLAQGSMKGEVLVHASRALGSRA